MIELPEVREGGMSGRNEQRKPGDGNAFKLRFLGLPTVHRALAAFRRINRDCPDGLAVMQSHYRVGSFVLCFAARHRAHLRRE